MTIQDPQQEIFSKLKFNLEALGFDVYDGFLPPAGTPYPFIYLGDNRQTDDPNKSAIFGNVYQTIHVWHSDPKRRGTVSEMLLKIKGVCHGINHTNNFAWNVRNTSQRIFEDRTTKTPLLHGVIEVEFKFN